MTAPSFTSLYEDISTRIETFYNNGSILTNNKYIVGLYGENVKKAIDKMSKKASGRLNSEETKTTPENSLFKGRENSLIIPKTTYEIMFNRWKLTFAPSKDNDEVELRWTASKVVIPTTQAVTEATHAMDSTKSLWYPIIKSVGKTSKVTLTIVEERGMGMYQFFNALMNQFFSTQVLKPKSSFQKLAMYIIILNGEYIEHNKKTHIIDIPLQIFEFNSIVPKGISDLTFESGETPNIISFTVDFDVPNVFQGSYASTTMKGLMDRTSDQTENGVLKDGNFTFKEGFFTIDKENLKSKENGWYDEDMK